MNSYEGLAAYYDRFTDDVGYEKWADYFETLFQKAGLSPHLVLDLACGTGSLCQILATRGYEMIGVDASPEMLMEAMNRTLDCPVRPIFLNQRMEQLDLYGTVDACLCSLDSVNYVTDPKDLQEAFRRVELFLEPGGIFIFDINSLLKFRQMDGECYVREDADVFCVWQVSVEGELCTYDFDIFRKQGKHWQRMQETHEERLYAPETICDMLTHAGFVDIRTYSDLALTPVTGREARIFFSARKRR